MIKLYHLLTPYIIIGSINYFFVKDALKFANPMAIMSLRYLIAFASMMLISYPIKHKIKIIINKDTFLLSLFTTISTALWIYGLIYLTPAESAVFGYTMPLFLVPVSYFILSEKPLKITLFGIFIGFSGVIIYSIFSSGIEFSIGAILTIMNAFFWALFTAYFRKLRNYNPLDIVSTQFLLTALMFSLPSAIEGDYKFNFNTEFVSDLIYISVLGGTILFLLWDFIVTKIDAVKASSYIFSIPALTMAIQSLISLSIPPLGQIIGAIIMFIGIYLSNSGGRRLKHN
jgi:EamA-like transporter family.